jgi:SdpC family antimicrobial peptide
MTTKLNYTLRRGWAWLFAIPVLLALSGSPGNLHAQTYSGVDIFKGIYFAEGPVAQMMPELRDYNIRNYTSDAEEIQESLDYQAEVISRIKSDDASYFQNFKAAMTSGNHYQIQTTLNDGYQLLDEVTIASGYERDLEKEAQLVEELASAVDFSSMNYTAIQSAVSNFYQNQGGAQAAEPCIVFEVWYVWIIVYKFVYETDDPTDDIEELSTFGDLHQERLINSIASRLSN